MRITAITPMKNEGPFILEWLAYHLMIGINDFVVFTNDCEDGTDAILERLDELGLVRHLPNPSCVRACVTPLTCITGLRCLMLMQCHVCAGLIGSSALMWMNLSV
ncbi:glycosyltransferase family 2 protein [Octadecabacter sp.]|nr:glycosyltransferase family 2 protein [Octadecabacter sp.]